MRFIVGILTTAAFLAACHELPSRRLVLRAGVVIEAVSAEVQTNMRIDIDDGKIVAIARDVGAPVPPDITVHDLREFTVLPGLVNAHTHLFAAPACTPGLGAGVTQALRNLHALQRAGVTTVADLGAPLVMATGLRRYVGTARHRGPRVVVAGPALTVPGGFPRYVDFRGDENGLVERVQTPQEARARIAQLVDGGVDLIKVVLRERTIDGRPLPTMSDDILCALVSEAHRQERRVVAHATTDEGYRLGLQCGVDGFIHGALEPLKAPRLARISARRTPVVPTLSAFAALFPDQNRMRRLYAHPVSADLTNEQRDDWEQFSQRLSESGHSVPSPSLVAGLPFLDLEDAVAASRTNVQRLHAAGVPIAFGTAGAHCLLPLGWPLDELAHLHESGLSRLEVLRTATWGGARLLDLHDAVGRVAVGYRADLIAVRGRPDQSLEDLQNVESVFIDGVKQRPPPVGWIATLRALLALAWHGLT